LLKIGVPFDTAWDMLEGGMQADAMAYIVASGEIEGGVFDWDRVCWEK
jgi:hypothetical protein